MGVSKVSKYRYIVLSIYILYMSSIECVWLFIPWHLCFYFYFRPTLNESLSFDVWHQISKSYRIRIMYEVRIYIYALFCLSASYISNSILVRYPSQITRRESTAGQQDSSTREPKNAVGGVADVLLRTAGRAQKPRHCWVRAAGRLMFCCMLLCADGGI